MTGPGPDDPEDSTADEQQTSEERNASEAQSAGVGATRRGAREGRQRLWRSLRTLVGLLLLSWLLAALFAPPDPFAFLLALVPAWVLAVPLAWYLVYRDGYDRLRASGLYGPAVPPAQALAAFVVVAVILKVAGTFALDFGIGSRSYLVDAAVSVVALALAYALVYLGSGGGSGDEDR